MKILVVVIMSLVAACASAHDESNQSQPTTTTAQDRVMADVYPGVASSGLVYARLASLPEEVVLRAGDWVVTEKDLDAEIGEFPPHLREQVRKNAFFVLERVATQKLLLQQATAAAEREGKDVSAMQVEELLNKYFTGPLSNVTVSESEITAFYEQNKDMVGGRPLDDVQEAIGNFLLRQKQQDAREAHIQAMGQRTLIEVAATWIDRQARLTLDNPVDKARAAGKPLLVIFSGSGCCPDRTTPLIEGVANKYKDSINVANISAVDDQILAIRYRVQAIPTLIVFDRDGKEVVRHSGVWPEDQVEQMLAKLSAK